MKASFKIETERFKNRTASAAAKQKPN